MCLLFKVACTQFSKPLFIVNRSVGLFVRSSVRSLFWNMLTAHGNWSCYIKYLYASSCSLSWSSSLLWWKGIQLRARCIWSGAGHAFLSPMSGVGCKSGSAFKRLSIHALYPEDVDEEKPISFIDVQTCRLYNKCIINMADWHVRVIRVLATDRQTDRQTDYPIWAVHRVA